MSASDQSVAGLSVSSREYWIRTFKHVSYMPQTYMLLIWLVRGIDVQRGCCCWCIVWCVHRLYSAQRRSVQRERAGCGGLRRLVKTQQVIYTPADRNCIHSIAVVCLCVALFRFHITRGCCWDMAIPYIDLLCVWKSFDWIFPSRHKHVWWPIHNNTSAQAHTHTINIHESRIQCTSRART